MWTDSVDFYKNIDNEIHIRGDVLTVHIITFIRSSEFVSEGLLTAKQDSFLRGENDPSIDEISFQRIHRGDITHPEVLVECQQCAN
jgi:hypothetical protein